MENYPTESPAPTPENTTVSNQSVVDPVQQPKLHSKLKITAWTLTILGIACFAAFMAVQFWLASLARSGTSGTEFIILLFLPLAFLGALLGLVGSILLVATARFHINRKNKTLAFGVGSLILALSALFIGVQAFEFFQQAHNLKETERVYTKSEMVKVIKSCQVDRFELSAQNTLTLSYLKNDSKTIYLPRLADPSGYDEYVAAAKTVESSCPTIDHSNFSPTASYDSASAKYVDFKTASALLTACKIKTFNISAKDGYKDSMPIGSKTGIILIDYGPTLKHLYADTTTRDSLTPVGRKAQTTCGGSPQFYTDNGGYEQSGTSK